MGTRAFYSNNLKTVTIPKSLISIIGYVCDNSNGSFEKENENEEQELLDSMDINYEENNELLENQEIYK